MIEIIKRPLRFVRREVNIQRARRQLNIKDSPNPFLVQIGGILKDLHAADIHLVQETLDDQAVSQFSRQAEYEFYYPNYYANKELRRLKKIREHYIAGKLLGLGSSDIYLDLASQNSPAPQIYERLYGCQVLRQDFEYPAGRHGRVLGGSAGQIQLGDNSITKAAMHCSLEHFEGDEDIALMKEIERILRPGGLFVVVPLYLSDEYFILTQPALYAELQEAEWPKFDPDATLYSADGGNRHERYYDKRHLFARIFDYTKLQVTLYCFGHETVCNLGQLRFAAVFRKSDTE